MLMPVHSAVIFQDLLNPRIFLSSTFGRGLLFHDLFERTLTALCYGLLTTLCRPDLESLQTPYFGGSSRLFLHFLFFLRERTNRPLLVPSRLVSVPPFSCLVLQLIYSNASEPCTSLGVGPFPYRSSAPFHRFIKTSSSCAR